MRTPFLAFLVVASTWSSAHALSIEAYQTYERRQIGDASAESPLTPAIVQAYFVGVAHSLNFLMAGQQPLSRGVERIACPPTGVQITGDLIEATLKSEVREAEKYRAMYGPEWKQLSVTVVVFPGLRRLFPCAP